MSMLWVGRRVRQLSLSVMVAVERANELSHQLSGEDALNDAPGMSSCTISDSRAEVDCGV